MSIGTRVKLWGEAVSETVAGWVSPKRAAMRAHFRRMANDVDYHDMIMAMMRTAGYRAAKTSTGATPWMGGNRTADEEITRDLPQLTARSQELNRDDPIASGLTLTFVTNIIGTGMRAQARTGDKVKDKALETAWKARADHTAPADDLTHPEAQRMRMRKVLEDGTVLVKATKDDAFSPLWFETIEKSRLQTPPGTTPVDARGHGMASPKGRIVDGVEKDEAGRPVAYWVLKGYGPKIGTAFTAAAYERVDATIANHLRRMVERPGQTHAVPMFHAILQDLRDLDLLLLASLKRVQIAACLSIFIESDLSFEEILPATGKKYGYKLDQTIEPGMIFKLYPGEKITTLLPNFPTPTLEPFIIMICRRIGAALGVSWQVVLKDFSKANYSSARTDLGESRLVWKILGKWFARKELTWEWEMVHADALMRGDPVLAAAGVTLADVHSVNWIPNGHPYVDPKKEAEAIKILLEIRATCLRDVSAQRGDDWEEIQDQLLLEERREIERREEENLPARKAEEPMAFPAHDDDKDDDEEKEGDDATDEPEA